MNGAGDDLGVVVARFSSDNVTMAVSTDGVTFTPDLVIPFSTAVLTSVGASYYYGGGGPFAAELFVHPINLDIFGIAGGSSIQAVRIGDGQLDLIRVAGLIPEPSAALLASFGLPALLALRRRKHR